MKDTDLNTQQAPARFVDSSDEADRDLHDLFAATAILRCTPDTTRRLIGRRLRAEVSVRRRKHAYIVRLVVALFSLFAFGGLVGAAGYRYVSLSTIGLRTKPAKPSAHLQSHLPTAPQLGPTRPNDHGEGDALSELPAAPHAPDNVRPSRTLRPAKRLALAVSPSKVAPESTYITQALRALRQQQSPASALQALDSYDANFGAGAFSAESQALRVEALVAMNRRREAIAVLDLMLAHPLPGGEARRLLRAELHAALGNFSAAVLDLDFVLDTQVDAPSSVVERALWARAVAHDHLGAHTAARADLREYTRRFPQGQFVPNVQKRLGL